MKFMKKNGIGIFLSLIIALTAWFLGNLFPLIGGPIIAIVIGMIFSFFIKDKTKLESGTHFVSKKILQYAVILLGFGLNFFVIFKTGKESLPIILSTITTSLAVAFFLQKLLHMTTSTAILIGVGSSICGGSAIAATAPVINADEDSVAQAISVIFLFNLLAALIFPTLGTYLGFSALSGEEFGLFAGTAINDTSSVTAAASTWDSMYHLGSSTLDKAITVKLTRTLAIIPITFILALYENKKNKNKEGQKLSLKKSFPFFILYFIGASLITTCATSFGAPPWIFLPFKELSKFMIILAMSAIGLNTNLKILVKSGVKPLFLGLCCWLSITFISILMQKLI